MSTGPDSDSDGDWRHDGAFADGVDELPIPHTGAGLDTTDTWEKGTRWFRNKPGPARDDQREGFDKKALGDGEFIYLILVWAIGMTSCFVNRVCERERVGLRVRDG